MSVLSADLRDFLDAVGKVADSAADSDAPLAESRGALDGTGLLDLGVDTRDEPDGPSWLAHSVRVTARSSPSLAYVLAARYAADLATGTGAELPDAVFAVTAPGTRAVVPTALTPRHLVLAGPHGVHAWTWNDVEGTGDDGARTGLRAAGLVSVDPPVEGTSLPVTPAAASTVWDLLVGAALTGVAERALEVSEAYVQERRQFGVPIADFTGLRALVAEMRLEVEESRALLDAALDGQSVQASLVAVAGRAAVDVCIDGIQSHGGYGYSDEYPLTGLLRDATSLQARTGGRRRALARVAERGLGRRTGAAS